VNFREDPGMRVRGSFKSLHLKCLYITNQYRNNYRVGINNQSKVVLKE